MDEFVSDAKQHIFNWDQPLPKMSNVEKKKYFQKMEILKNLYFKGAKTNAEICAAFHISSPTSIRLLNSLIADGLIKKEGLGVSIGGRKPDLYRLKEGCFYILSIQVDRFKIKMALVDNNNTKMSFLDDIPYHIEKDLQTIDSFYEIAVNLVEESGIDQEKLMGIGISMPGLVSSKEGKNFTYFLTETESESLQEILNRKFSKPVFILNDAKSACLGEFYFGLAKQKKNALVISMDWGLGLGIIIDGKMHHGISGFAGEFGHIPLIEDGLLCHCGKRGCLETVASGIALTRMAKNGLSSGENSILNKKFKNKIENVHPKDVIEAADKGDQFAINILSEIGINLGKGIAILIQLFNPERIIIEGEFAVAQQYITTPIQQSVNMYCMAQIREKTEISLSNLGGDSVLLGSAAGVMEKIFERQLARAKY